MPGSGHRLFEADRRYEGYSWYDSLARASRGGLLRHPGRRHAPTLRSCAASTPTTSPRSIRASPRATRVPTRSRSRFASPAATAPAETIPIPADLAFVGEAWCDTEEIHPLVTSDSELEPHVLAAIVQAAYFCPSDDADSDSWETQRDRFQADAMHAAIELLASEDEARKHTIARTIRC